jgi:hypothetical protein
MQIPFPNNKKSMQSFFGKINFVRRFVFDFAEIVKPLQQMIKKDVKFKWTTVEKVAFEKVKVVIEETPSIAKSIFF